MNDWICTAEYVGDFVQEATVHVSLFGYILDPP
jgi:hypothetical protein